MQEFCLQLIPLCMIIYKNLFSRGPTKMIVYHYTKITIIQNNTKIHLYKCTFVHTKINLIKNLG